MTKAQIKSSNKELQSLYSELYKNICLTQEIEARYSELLNGIEKFSSERSADLKQLDKSREKNSTWYLDKKMLGMTMYTDLFAGNLQGLIKKIPYLEEQKITYLHLMPLLKMPHPQNDGGYAIEDFNSVDSKFGTNDDLQKLTSELRKNKISLCLDFVLNHTADSHEWALEAKNGNAEYQKRYMLFDDRKIPDEYENTVPQVFPSSAPGNFTWNDQMKKWVFTSFYPYQWDLNYCNPVVLNEMIFSMLHLANMGVEIFRLDAIPYIWKELGTSCRNLKQVHTIIRIIRIVTEEVCPAVILKGEVVMAPNELAAYFGTTEKPECHILYNVSAMVNLWSALASKDVRLLKSQIDQFNSLGEKANFINYIRCHDDIGWGLDEPYERSIGIDPLLHKIFLYKFYEGAFPGSFARGELYNYDESTRDARSCGTTASLCGIENALQDNNSDEISKSIKRDILMHAAMFSLKGFPMLSSGDEIAQLNDYSYKDDVNRKDDSRNVHRSVFNWSNAELRKTKNTIQNEVWTKLKKLEKIRRECSCFSEAAEFSTWDSHNNSVFAVKRAYENETLLCVANFSEQNQNVHFDYFVGEYTDLFTGKKLVPGLGFNMEGYEYIYLLRTKE